MENRPLEDHYRQVVDLLVGELNLHHTIIKSLTSALTEAYEAGWRDGEENGIDLGIRIRGKDLGGLRGGPG